MCYNIEKKGGGLILTLKLVPTVISCTMLLKYTLSFTFAFVF